MSSFSSLNLGSRAIFAAQRGLDVTGQNIANSATPGYSRQRVDQVAVGGPTVPAIWAKYDGAGGGVKVTGVSRMRDEFLEARARTAAQNRGELTELQGTYEAVERTIGEPSDTGLKQRLADFWNAWSTAGNDLKSEAPRQVVVERGVAVADQLNRMASQLEVQWADTRTQAQANIDEVNTAAANIAKLNRAIRNNVINGLPANELADQRDLLVEKVTTLTGGVAEQVEDGVVNVKMADGAYLVSGQQAGKIGLVNDSDGLGGPLDTYAKYVAAGTPTLAIGWAKTVGQVDVVPPAAISGFGSNHSTLNGQLQSVNTVVPSYLQHLDTIAAQVQNAVNTQQPNGYTVTGVQGGDLFSGATLASTSPPAGTARAAVNIRFSGKAADLALSSGQPGVPTGGVLDGNNAKAMAQHINDPGGADDSLRAMVVQLGVAAAGIYNSKTAADSVSRTADDARDSVSGVSINEEMTNLLQYQHSFEAAAKFITAIDATIESLLNMTH